MSDCDGEAVSRAARGIGAFFPHVTAEVESLDTLGNRPATQGEQGRHYVFGITVNLNVVAVDYLREICEFVFAAKRNSRKARGPAEPFRGRGKFRS